MTKGILAGLGTNKVTGTVKGVSITNSVSDYEDWNTAATFGEEEFIFKVTNISFPPLTTL